MSLTLAFLWVSEVVDSKDRFNSALALSSSTHNRPSNTAASSAMGSSEAGFRQKWLSTFTSSGKVLVFCKVFKHFLEVAHKLINLQKNFSGSHSFKYNIGLFIISSEKQYFLLIKWKHAITSLILAKIRFF